MKLGMNKAEMPEVKVAEAGKAALKIIGIGLAAGVALIAATDTVMKKATSPKDSSADIEPLEYSDGEEQ